MGERVVMKENVLEKEIELKLMLEELLFNCKRPIEMTNLYVYGKEVHYKKKVYELENWYIRVPVHENTHLLTLFDCLQCFIEEKEFPKNYTLKQINKSIMHQLCDWCWLENEDGKIIIDGKATLVKYAVITRK